MQYLTTKPTCRSSLLISHRKPLSITVRAHSRAEKEVAKTASPLLLATTLLLTGALSGGILETPPAFADEAADRRAAVMAKRKAILAESRAKAEAGLSATSNKVAEADAEVDRKNAERARLAALRAADIDKQRTSEYERAAASSIKDAPPV